jgi:hypothetical protein
VIYVHYIALLLTYASYKKENSSIKNSDGEKTIEQKAWIDAVHKYTGHGNVQDKLPLLSSIVSFVFRDVYLSN